MLIACSQGSCGTRVFAGWTFGGKVRKKNLKAKKGKRKGSLKNKKEEKDGNLKRKKKKERKKGNLNKNEDTET